MRVKNKSIIVTGAGGGIGEGIALRLAAEGAHVIVNDINAALGEQVVLAGLRHQGIIGGLRTLCRLRCSATACYRCGAGVTVHFAAFGRLFFWRCLFRTFPFHGL